MKTCHKKSPLTSTYNLNSHLLKFYLINIQTNDSKFIMFNKDLFKELFFIMLYKFILAIFQKM